MSTARASSSVGWGGGSAERNLGRRRALKAWVWVEQAKGLGEDYARLAQKLPSMLQVSGLGQTLAFLYAKGYENGRPMVDRAEGRLLHQVADYLCETQKRPLGTDPMEALLALDSAAYRTATREIAAVAVWLKRFAAGRLPKDRS